MYRVKEPVGEGIGRNEGGKGGRGHSWCNPWSLSVTVIDIPDVLTTKESLYQGRFGFVGIHMNRSGDKRRRLRLGEDSNDITHEASAPYASCSSV